ncbi:MAG: glycosyltransferase family 2 protein [Pseudomonadota bacterium]
MGLKGGLRRLELRLERRALQVRARVKGLQLRRVFDRTSAMPPGPILFSTVRNEAHRLPWFLKHYRDLGVVHFLIVDNGSEDGTADLLHGMPDVSLWQTRGSYRASRFGVDWLNWLLSRYGVGRWILVADPDELLIYPHHDTRKLPALCRWLEDQGRDSFGTLLLDMYGSGSVEATRATPDADPTRAACWFDANNYYVSRDPRYRNLWVQGGPRMRIFFADSPRWAPALNKIPLVHWQAGFVYKAGAHDLLPRRLNRTYAQDGGSITSGVLLHPKFIDLLVGKVDEEMRRRQHYAGSMEYASYAAEGPELSLWTSQSTPFRDWRQLCDLGLMARGGWF